MKNSIEYSWHNTLKTFNDFGNNEDNFIKISQIAKVIADGFVRGNKVLIAGNGGNACDAMHFAQEFIGKF